MKKIAVYIIGHFRNFNETWPQYKTIFTSSPEAVVDVFITFWDIRNTNDLTKVTEDDIRAICPEAKHIEILSSNQLLNQHGHTDAIVGYLYSLQEGVRNLPETYDYYIRLRSDLYFFEKEFFQQILSHNDSVDLWISDKVWYNEANYPAQTKFNDYLWIGSYTVTKYLADTYSNLETLSPTYMEELLAQRLRSYPTSINIKHFHCLFNLDRRTRGEDIFLVESQELTRLRQAIENKQIKI